MTDLHASETLSKPLTLEDVRDGAMEPSGLELEVPSDFRRSSRITPLDILGPLAVFAIFIGLWYFMSYRGLPPEKQFLLPPPHEVIQVGVLDWANLQPILQALWLTTQVAVLGLAIAIVLGMTTAIIMSQARWVEKSLWPYAVALQCIPILALTPLIGGLMGFSFSARVLVTVMICLFPIISNTLFGLLSVDKAHHELFTLQGVSRVTRLRKLQLPAAMPAIFAGFRISAGLAVIGAVVGDTFFRQGEPGVGSLIDVYRNRLRGEEMITAIILAALLGLTFFWLFGYLNKKAVGHWHESNRGG